ncbi:MAG: hypothetical protein ACRENX_04890 [Candidatus Dormibacteria bacterium]
MINLYAAQKYTARRQADERESARVWRLARELRQPEQGTDEAAPPPGRLPYGCDIDRSPRRRFPLAQ